MFPTASRNFKKFQVPVKSRFRSPRIYEIRATLRARACQPSGGHRPPGGSWWDGDGSMGAKTRAVTPEITAKIFAFFLFLSLAICTTIEL